MVFTSDLLTIMLWFEHLAVLGILLKSNLKQIYLDLLKRAWFGTESLLSSMLFSSRLGPEKTLLKENLLSLADALMIPESEQTFLRDTLYNRLPSSSLL